MTTETEAPLTENDFSAIDREALNRALSIALADDEREGCDQIKSHLAEDGWFEAALTAVYRLQYHALGLSPNQEPPCHGQKCPVTGNENIDAAKLMKRLVSHGCSMYDPDPIAAINAAKKRK